jgi:hypothetical protein
VHNIANKLPWRFGDAQSSPGGWDNALVGSRNCVGRMALVASESVPHMRWLLSDFFDSFLPHWFQSHLKKQCMHHLSDFSLC